MSVIAIRDGVVAADAAVCHPGFGMSYGSVDKIIRINDWIVGCAGSLNTAKLFFRWMRGARVAVDWSQIHGIALRPDGKILEFSGGREPLQINMPYGSAIGSGANTAIAAMMAGADARRAVEITAELDHECGLPVKVLKITDDET